jgi:hypothetical protein
MALVEPAAPRRARLASTMSWSSAALIERGRPVLRISSRRARSGSSASRRLGNRRLPRGPNSVPSARSASW